MDVGHVTTTAPGIILARLTSNEALRVEVTELREANAALRGEIARLRIG